MTKWYPTDGASRRRLLAGAGARALMSASTALVLGVTLSSQAHAGPVTVNPVQTTTYNLQPSANPITFGSGTKINASSGSGVYGGNGATWTITNYGSIGAPSFPSNAIKLNLGGAVTNQSGGVISGFQGIYIKGGPGTVTNAGTITTTAGAGVFLLDGGSVTNEVGGVINSHGPSVTILGAGTIVNAGSLTAATYVGVAMIGSGTLVNQSTGTIVGDTSGVYSKYNTVTVTNAGHISAIGVNSSGVAMIGGGTVINNASGTITGTGSGVYGKTGGVTVNNTGAISATGTNGAALALFAGGTVNNYSGGTITGNAAGVYGKTGAITVTNAGTITSIGAGVADAAVALFAGGAVTNQTGGVITGNDVGVYIKGGSGSVTNAGQITGTTASVEFLGSGANTLTLQTGSTLTGDAFGSTAGGATNALILQGTGAANNNFFNFNTLTVQATGTWTLGGTSTIGTTEVTTGTLLNTGSLSTTMTVDAGAALINSGTLTDTFGHGIQLQGGNTVANQSTGTIIGYFGLGATGDNVTITNAGAIRATEVGVYLRNASSLTNQATGAIFGGYGVLMTGAGTVTNAGRIDGFWSVGVALLQGGTITNQTGGEIYGASFGVATGYPHHAGPTPGPVTLTNSGTIYGYVVGAFLRGSATVTNAGAIVGTGEYGIGIIASKGGTIANLAGGTISGAYGGLFSNSSATTVTNAGTISGTGLPGYFTAGVSLFAGGSVTNYGSGTISGVNAGVYGVGASVTNFGSITSSNGAGVSLLGGGSVTNQTGGVITGADVGVYVVGGSSTVTNAGAITSSNGVGVLLAGGGSVSNQTGGVITGATVGVYVAGASSTVTNAGTISGHGTYGAGVELSVGGTVINNAGGTITGAQGIYSESGAVTVTNAGVISGTGNYGVGVNLFGGGVVTNQTGGVISGTSEGVFVYGASPSVITNAGSISGTNVGVVLIGGGTVTNTTGGTITGKLYGVYGGGAATTVTNAGAITSSSGAGVVLGSGGAVINQTGGVITGGTYGVFVAGGGAVTNAGLITGTTASVVFEGVGSNTLTLQTGGALSGEVDGSTAAGATNALVLQGTGVADNNFFNFNTLTVQGAGTWTLNGFASVGTATINAGDLEVGDGLHASAELMGNVTVNTGATLSGHGTIVGNVLNNGGTVSPGGTIGALTVIGDYTQSSGGLLSLEATPYQSSVLEISGTATLAGALEFITGPGIYRKGTQYDFLVAGSVVGAFTSVSATDGATFTISTTAGGLVATQVSGVYVPVNATPNQEAVGVAFSNYPVGVSDFDPVADALINLPTTAQQNAAFDRLGGEVDADFLTVARDDVRAFLGGIEDQSAGTGAPKSGPNAAWGYVTGSSDTTHGDGNAHGYGQHSGGVAFGGERDWGPSTRLGAAFNYDHSDFSLEGLSQSGSLDTVAGGLYGRHDFGNVFVDGAGSLGWDSGDSTRTIAFAGVGRRATGHFNGLSAGGLISVGGQLHGPDGLLIEPSVSLVGSSVRQGGFTETGATGADLAVDSRTQATAETLVGARFVKSFTMTGGVLDLDGRLAWAHELNPDNPTIGESFAAAPGTHFVLAGANPGRDFTVIGAGLTYKASSKLSAYIRYNGSVSSQQSDQTGTLGLKYSW